jgi:ligand-binding sensor domain-containing protein/two-component sensor histidine kinase
VLKHHTFIAFLLCCCTAWAQQPYSYSIDDNTGLPSNEVYDLYQDDFGFMWLGTNSGLFKYDGTDFIAVKSTQQTGKAISHLTIDGDKKLWCQNFSGQMFSVSGDSLKTEHNWSSRKRNFPAFAFQKNTVWITGDSGLYGVSAQTGKLLQLYNMQTLAGAHTAYELIEIEAIGNRLYYSEKSAIGFIEDNKVTRLKSDRPVYTLTDVVLGASFHSVGNHTYLIVRADTINSVWEVKNDSVVWLRNLPAELGRVFTAYDDRQGRWWIAGGNGAYCVNYELQEQYGGLFFFPGKSVSKVLLDKEGNYWFSTLQDGIFIVPGTDVWVHTEDNSPLPDTRIRQLATDGMGNLFIGYQNGHLSKYNIHTRQVNTISFESSGADIQALLCYTGNTLLVAQGKTWQVNTQTMHAEMVSGISNVKTLCATGPDTLVAGTVSGALLFKPGTTARYIQTLRPKRVRAVFYDKRHLTLWVAYADGLYMYTYGTATEVRVKGQSVYGTDIVQTQNGIVWVGTVSSGLIGFNNGKETAPLQCYLPNSFVRKLAATGNTLWIAAEDRLIRYNVETGKNKTYNKFDGLPSYEIADIEIAAGKVWLATPRGLVEIPEDFNAINNVPPSVFISGFAIHERDTLLSLKYELPFENNNIRISFKGIAFRSQGMFTYRYRLLGLDTNWITTNSSSNLARYPSLPAGNYTFQVVALNEDGVPSKAPATLSIVILKPFWQKWWFYVLCALALVALVSVAFILRIRYIRRKGELEKRAVNSQLAALKSQMNPHFMFNALNSIQDLVLQRDTDNAQLYLGKFSELTRKVLEASGKEFITLARETDMLSLYLDLERLRFGNDFAYSITIAGDIEPEETMLPSMIIQPFVENALKHGLLHKTEHKQLTVSFSVKENVLVCEVDDNGVGRKVSAEINARRHKHTGFATEATTERIRLLNELHNMKIDLKITDKEQGTLVTIKIPLSE